MLKIAHARRDENGKYRNGKAGDQDGKELCITDWYNRPWNVVIRAKEENIAKAIALSGIAACKNEHIGYDQIQRTTLFDIAKTFGFDISKVNTPCETDCSALVAVCVNAAGVTVPKTIYTGNMVNALKQTGKFHILKEKALLQSYSQLKIGDILVYEGHHTAIVVSDIAGNIISNASMENMNSQSLYNKLKKQESFKKVKEKASLTDDTMLFLCKPKKAEILLKKLAKAMA